MPNFDDIIGKNSAMQQALDIVERHRQLVENATRWARPAWMDEGDRLTRLVESAQSTMLLHDIGSALVPTAYTNLLERASISDQLAVQALSEPLSIGLTKPWWNDTLVPNVAAFSAASFALKEHVAVGASMEAMIARLSVDYLPDLSSLDAYRSFLDTVGFDLPRLPTVRFATVKERKRRFAARLREHSAPQPVRRARDLVHQYEIALQDVIALNMEDEYGPEWMEERLLACDCKDLLGRWRARGGNILDHADYPHYRKILCHPEHFEAVFRYGFDDSVALGTMIDRARALRAKSHHPPYDFTAADLVELRTTWKQLEAGMALLVVEYAFD